MGVLKQRSTTAEKGLRKQRSEKAETQNIKKT